MHTHLKYFELHLNLDVMVLTFEVDEDVYLGGGVISVVEDAEQVSHATQTALKDTTMRRLVRSL